MPPRHGPIARHMTVELRQGAHIPGVGRDRRLGDRGGVVRLAAREVERPLLILVVFVHMECLC